MSKRLLNNSLNVTMEEALDDDVIDALLARIKVEAPSEIILALGADVEGEATANYLAGLLREFPVAVTRLAPRLLSTRRLLRITALIAQHSPRRTVRH